MKNIVHYYSHYLGMISDSSGEGVSGCISFLSRTYDKRNHYINLFLLLENPPHRCNLHCKTTNLFTV